MNKDRVDGAARQAKGAVEETAGKIAGDAKLQDKGIVDKASGKIQNSLGKAEDAVKGK